MNINDMTRKQFDEIPWRDDWQQLVECDGLVILPLRVKHDSGYRCMDFVAVRDGEPVCRLSGSSDVVNLDGIGGFGQWTPSGGLPASVLPKGWAIDCLPKSGLLRLFARNGLIAGACLSSFEIWAK